MVFKARPAAASLGQARLPGNFMCLSETDNATTILSHFFYA
jgi:hypothetical protein